MSAARFVNTLFPSFAMAVTLVAAIVIGGLFFLRRTGDRRANGIYGALLLAGGLTQLHFLLGFRGAFAAHPPLEFIPIYFTLWLPVLLFFYVKLSLFPHYRPRWTDAKHLAFPLGQLVFFVAVWLFPELRRPEGRYFYSPFYGGLEQALYLIYWPMYVFFSYQYYRHRRRQQSRSSLPRLMWYIRKLLKGVMLFVIAYAILALGDFVSFKYFSVDLRNRNWYAGVQSLSFSVLLLWLAVYGFQVLLWGRRLLRR